MKSQEANDVSSKRARLSRTLHRAQEKLVCPSLFSPLIVRCNIRRGYALGRFQ
jgi:hypothetical protein